MGAAPGSGIPRRRVLVGLLLLPPAVSACGRGPSAARAPDPLIALADAARSDAALAAAAITADRSLAERVAPLVDARTAHAAALDAEVARLRPDRAAATPAPAPPVDGAVPLARVRAAARSAAAAAAAAALDLPVDRVGLVASAAACCASYATVLT